VENVTRHQWISVAAYNKAEVRRFTPGRESDDGLVAENDYVKMETVHYLTIVDENGAMNINGLQNLVISIGVESAYRIAIRFELIDAIQNAAHHYPCFHADQAMASR